MWLFEKRGFVSVVAYDPKKDRNKDSQFPEISMRGKTEYDHSHLLVRARILEDLDMLKLVVPSLHVETDKSADYSFRAIITRKQMKKFLNRAVDDLDYDSHFKEAARDNSPKAEGRYSAMMSIWSAMAKLQPYSPYGGSGGSYGGFSSYGSYGSVKKSGSTDSITTFKNEKDAPSATERGVADLETFIEEYIASGGDKNFKSGNGPLVGFKVGDKVAGFFGEGVVTKISPRGVGKADLVAVRHSRAAATGSKNVITKTSNFLSNYLIPAVLPDIDGEDVGEEFQQEDLNLDWMYDYLKEKPRAHEFPVDVLNLLDDDAFELLTLVQEATSEDESVGKEDLDTLYDEVSWKSLTDEDKAKLAAEGTVPEKFVSEAVELFSHKA